MKDGNRGAMRVRSRQDYAYGYICCRNSRGLEADPRFRIGLYAAGSLAASYTLIVSLRNGTRCISEHGFGACVTGMLFTVPAAGRTSGYGVRRDSSKGAYE